MEGDEDAHPRSPRICVQYGCVESRDQLWSILYEVKRFANKVGKFHTPASTLVKSSTLVPESGSVDVSTVVEENARKNSRCHDRQCDRVAKLRSIMPIASAHPASSLS
jgi:hypothetical protein